MFFPPLRLLVLIQLLVVFCQWATPSSSEHDDDGELLFPISGETRHALSLDGNWTLRFAKMFDAEEGFRDSWFSQPLALNGSVFDVRVPGNLDQVLPLWQYSTDGKMTAPAFYPGWIWYERDFFLPMEWKESRKRIFLRVGAAHYCSVVYVNGQKVKEHQGGSVPFVVELTTDSSSSSAAAAELHYEPAKNRLTIAVNSTLTPETIPQGELVVHTVPGWKNYRRLAQGGVLRDYWTYAGLHGSVILYTTPRTFIQDINVTTDHASGMGYVNYSVRALRPGSFECLHGGPKGLYKESVTGKCQFMTELIDKHGQIVASGSGGRAGVLQVPNARLWWPYGMVPDNQTGYVYTLKVKLTDLETLEQDVYTLLVGVRSVRRTDNSLLINDMPFYLRGIFPRECQKIRCHDTEPDKAVDLARMSFWELNRYLKTNSVRGLYYPVSEDVIRQADRLGFAIVSEVPAVELRNFGNNLLDRHKQILRALIQRDKNSPSVIIFSLANLVIEDDSNNSGAGMVNESSEYFRELAEFGRGADPQKRPLTAIVRAQHIRSSSIVKHLDILGLSWHKTTLSGVETWELSQTAIVQDIIEWSRESVRMAERKPLLLIAEMGVHPTHLHIDSCSLSDSYERHAFEELQANVDRLESHKEVPLIGEMNWSCSNDNLLQFSWYNDRYFCARIHERFTNKSSLIPNDNGTD